MNKKDIAFWGTPPPPIGGMTVHIDRLSKKLIQSGFSCTMYNFKPTNRTEPDIVNVKSPLLWYLSLLFGKSPKVHYVITTRTVIRFSAVLFGILRNKKIVLRVGGRSLEYGLNSKSLFEKWLSIFSLKFCTAFIGVSNEICNLARRHTREDKIHHIPGFIKPMDDGTTAPETLIKFFSDCDLRILVTGQVADKDKEDIYGLWDVLAAIDKIAKTTSINIKCIVVSYTISGNNDKAIKSYSKKIEELGLENNVCLYQNEGELWPLFKIANMFLRPSTTDGDSNALREALSFNLTCIASDVVLRPQGTIVYKGGDLESLIEGILNAHNGHVQIQQNNKEKDNAEKILALIESL